MPRWTPGVSGNPLGRSHHAKSGDRGKDERYSSRKEWEPCPICGVIIRVHKRCTLCSILIGPGHYDTRLTSDSRWGRCGSCSTVKWETSEGRCDHL